MAALRRGWFEGKRWLDIGCNAGYLTISIGGRRVRVRFAARGVGLLVRVRVRVRVSCAVSGPCVGRWTAAAVCICVCGHVCVWGGGGRTYVRVRAQLPPLTSGSLWASTSIRTLCTRPARFYGSGVPLCTRECPTRSCHPRSLWRRRPLRVRQRRRRGATRRRRGATRRPRALRVAPHLLARPPLRQQQGSMTRFLSQGGVRAAAAAAGAARRLPPPLVRATTRGGRRHLGSDDAIAAAWMRGVAHGPPPTRAAPTVAGLLEGGATARAAARGRVVDAGTGACQRPTTAAAATSQRRAPQSSRGRAAPLCQRLPRGHPWR